MFEGQTTNSNEASIEKEPKLELTPLTEERLEEAIALVHKVFPESVGWIEDAAVAYPASLDKEKHRAQLDEMGVRTLQYWIVSPKDHLEKIVGVTGLFERNDEPEDVTWLGWYCVDPEARGHGYGKEIVKKTIEIARERGYKKFRVYTTTLPNEAVAQHVYEGFGFRVFKEEEREDGYKDLYREKEL